MGALTIEHCPETGICSVIKADGKRVDLMPDEVGQLRDASGDTDAVKTVLAGVDGAFADSLVVDELEQLSRGVK